MKINSAPSPHGKFTCINKAVFATYFKRTDFGAYGYVSLSHLGNIIMRVETTTYFNMTNIVVFSTVKNYYYTGLIFSYLPLFWSLLNRYPEMWESRSHVLYHYVSSLLCHYRFKRDLSCILFWYGELWYVVILIILAPSWALKFINWFRSPLIAILLVLYIRLLIFQPTPT